MHKLLVLSDLHITEPGETIIGLDPAARLTEVLDHALEYHGDASHIVLSGDLAHHGRAAQYHRLRNILADLPLPVIPMLGNHDDRAAFRAAFPEAPGIPQGHVQHAFDAGPVRVITLDTLEGPGHGGALCAARLDWLDQALDAAAPRPTLVITHHHPFRTGFDGMDGIGLADPESLLSRLRAAPHVRHLICGHVHRTISGSLAGLPVSVLKSPCHQMPMQLGDGSSALSVDQPAGYGVVLLSDDQIIVHNVEPRHDSHSPQEDARSC